MKRRKIIYIICLISVFVLNIFYVNYEFYALMLMVILIPVISLVLFLIAKYNVELYFRVPDKKVKQGDKIVFELKINNNIPIFLANSQVNFAIGCSNVAEYRRETFIISTILDSGRKRVKDTAEHSGIISISAERIKMFDYLQIFSKVKNYRGVSQIPVFPLLLPASERDNNDLYNGVEINNDRWTLLSGDSDESVDVREYQDGDSMNRIHWKLSVKTDELIVRKFGDINDRCIRILVDLSLTNDKKFRDNLDKIYQMSYSIGHYYAKCSIKASFMVWDESGNGLVDWEFSTDEELDEALIALMKLPCTVNAGGMTEAAFEESGIKVVEQPYWITAKAYKSKIYQVVNVVTDDLEQMMDTLYKG